MYRRAIAKRKRDARLEALSHLARSADSVSLNADLTVQVNDRRSFWTGPSVMRKWKLLVATILGGMAGPLAPLHPVLVAGSEGGLGTPHGSDWLAHPDALQLYRPAYGDEGGEGGEGGKGHRVRTVYRTVYVAPFPLPYQPSACPPVITPGVLSKETIGLILGGVAGGVTGAQIGHGKGQLVATGVGTLLGAIIGREIGASLDRADQVAAVAAEHQALSGPPGCQVRWQNQIRAIPAKYDSSATTPAAMAVTAASTRAPSP